MDFNLQYENNRIYAENASGQLIAEITFPYLSDNKVDINHTFVDPSLRGQGVAGILMEAAVQKIKSKNLKTDTSCPYAQKWFLSHPEFNDLLV